MTVAGHTDQPDLKDVVASLVERVWTHADPAAIDEHFLPGFVAHFPGRPPVCGPAEFATLVAEWRAALPDLREQILVRVRDGDRVFVQSVLTGTHRGLLRGIPPTGTVLRLQQMVIVRFDGGRVAELWQQGDHLGLLGQLGMLPPEGAGPLGQLAHTLRVIRRLAALRRKGALRRKDARRDAVPGAPVATDQAIVATAARSTREAGASAPATGVRAAAGREWSPSAAEPADSPMVPAAPRRRFTPADSYEFLDRCWRAGDPTVCADMVLPQCRFHIGTRPPLDRDEFTGMVRDIRRGKPDLRTELLDILVDGDLVCGRVRFTGTHTGALLGIPPTGRRLAMEEMFLLRWTAAGIAEFHGEGDFAGMLDQMGVLPPPGAGPVRLLRHTLATIARFARLQAAASLPGSSR
jgi:predicted ester cyclase